MSKATAVHQDLATKIIKDPQFEQRDFVDGILDKLLKGKEMQKEKNYGVLNDSVLTKEEVFILVVLAQEVFWNEPVLVEIPQPVKVFGDIHGQFSDLLRLFELVGYPDDDPNNKYLFLGDYVDRGKQSIESICLLFAYKLKYPQKFFLLRGNHEVSSINRIYGFYDECKRKYDLSLWKAFTLCFNWLPIAGLVGQKILCMHGGLSPDLLETTDIMRIERPTDVPDKGLLCDLLWSDPDKTV